MSHYWLNVTPKLEEGAKLLNSLSRPQFNSLLKQITQEKFTSNDLSTLQDSLKLDSSKIQLLVQSLTHILKQSSKIIVKPTVLQEQLTETLKFSEDKAEDFVRVWTEETKRSFDVENSKNLEDVSWELNLEAASNFCSNDSHVNARMQMTLVSVDKKEKERVVLELDEKELENLYITLENIQNKLDNL